MKTVAFRNGLVVLLLFAVHFLYAQFNCELVHWDFIKDTISFDGSPAAHIQLSSDENTLGTGYTTILILNDSGDTIVDYSENPSFWLPAIAPFGEPVVNHVLKLEPGVDSIGSNFSGIMFTNYPECTFGLVVVTNVEEVNFDQIPLSYPNPFNDFLIMEKGETEHFEVCNLLGQLIYKNEFGTARSLRINTTNWLPGYYFIRRGKRLESLIKN